MKSIDCTKTPHEQDVVCSVNILASICMGVAVNDLEAGGGSFIFRKFEKSWGGEIWKPKK
jgi:hypothetical protein